ncbi:T9SS type A sorting domain-containing protein [uncultured Algibacter sp.]|jgi:acetyl esterase/lipase|uniref:T9SS type A sorting domain-containing protein n=1 Tax=uncultured Algibacter sp. TaxID=298659 RepID=UPI0026010C04|nr:T9SS type A sorting domain-containing protein [uncultured Algibacter sp.]
MKKSMKLNLFVSTFLLFTFSGIAQINPQFNPVPASYNVNSPNPVYAWDINYDNIDLNKQVFHLFLPDTTGNFPLVVFIHGGGYIGGTPDIVTTPVRRQDIKYFLENGIAFASVGYRLINNTGPDTEGVIKCLNDAKRALQFIRYNASDLYIDPTKIALQGRSAGASSSYWLGTLPDMADPNATDPILQESTRVCAVDLYGSQATLDMYKWETQVFDNFDGNGTNYTLDEMENLMGFERTSNFYGGFNSISQILVDPALIQYRQDVDQLFHLSNDDPPMYISSQSLAVHPSQDLVHHSFHGREIHNTALAVGVSEVKADIPALSINTTNGESGIEFLVRHLNSCSNTLTVPDIQVSENYIDIFPNPIVNQFTIKSKSTIYKIDILDVNGRILQTINNIENYHTMDISAMSNGLYFIRASDRLNNILEVQKIIKL